MEKKNDDSHDSHGMVDYSPQPSLLSSHQHLQSNLKHTGTSASNNSIVCSNKMDINATIPLTVDTFHQHHLVNHPNLTTTTPISIQRSIYDDFQYSKHSLYSDWMEYSKANHLNNNKLPHSIQSVQRELKWKKTELKRSDVNENTKNDKNCQSIILDQEIKSLQRHVEWKKSEFLSFSRHWNECYRHMVQLYNDIILLEGHNPSSCENNDKTNDTNDDKISKGILHDGQINEPIDGFDYDYHFLHKKYFAYLKKYQAIFDESSPNESKDDNDNIVSRDEKNNKNIGKTTNETQTQSIDSSKSLSKEGLSLDQTKSKISTESLSKEGSTSDQNSINQNSNNSNSQSQTLVHDMKLSNKQSICIDSQEESISKQNHKQPLLRDKYKEYPKDKSSKEKKLRDKKNVRNNLIMKQNYMDKRRHRKRSNSHRRTKQYKYEYGQRYYDNELDDEYNNRYEGNSSSKRYYSIDRGRRKKKRRSYSSSISRYYSSDSYDSMTDGSSQIIYQYEPRDHHTYKTHQIIRKSRETENDIMYSSDSFDDEVTYTDRKRRYKYMKKHDQDKQERIKPNHVKLVKSYRSKSKDSNRKWKKGNQYSRQHKKTEEMDDYYDKLDHLESYENNTIVNTSNDTKRVKNIINFNKKVSKRSKERSQDKIIKKHNSKKESIPKQNPMKNSKKNPKKKIQPINDIQTSIKKKPKNVAKSNVNKRTVGALDSLLNVASPNETVLANNAKPVESSKASSKPISKELDVLDDVKSLSDHGCMDDFSDMEESTNSIKNSISPKNLDKQSFHKWNDTNTAKHSPNKTDSVTLSNPSSQLELNQLSQLELNPSSLNTPKQNNVIQSGAQLARSIRLQERAILNRIIHSEDDSDKSSDEDQYFRVLPPPIS